MTMGKTRRNGGGFSLVELMVSVVLGMMLMAGAISIYLASKRSYVEVEQVAALTESARFAEQILGDSLRHMGFFGEVQGHAVELDGDLTPVVGDCATPAIAGAYNLTRLGYAETADSSGNALGCITDARPGTDVLVIKHALPQAYSDGPRQGGDPNDPSHSDGVIDTPQGLEAEATYIMTNSLTGVLFDGADTPPTIVTGGEVPGGTAWEYQYEVYYIRQKTADDIPQLSRKSLTWDSGAGAMTLETEDVAEGVEWLHLVLGYDSDNNGEVDTYSNLAGVGNWSQVESVEVFMLIRSATNDVAYTDTKTYNLGAGMSLTAGDAAIPDVDVRRLVSHTSISLRNLKLVIRGGA